MNEKLPIVLKLRQLNDPTSKNVTVFLQCDIVEVSEVYTKCKVMAKVQVKRVISPVCTFI